MKSDVALPRREPAAARQDAIDSCEDDVVAAKNLVWTIRTCSCSGTTSRTWYTISPPRAIRMSSGQTRVLLCGYHYREIETSPMNGVHPQRPSLVPTPAWIDPQHRSILKPPCTPSTDLAHSSTGLATSCSHAQGVRPCLARTRSSAVLRTWSQAQLRCRGAILRACCASARRSSRGARSVQASR